MTELFKERMNLAAITKVDPFAKEIVSSSRQAAFYIYNNETEEWKKGDVEGPFFIYGRHTKPYYSMFINNRANTTTFVEPITATLEVHLKPPFLLYRIEKSQIRALWFYNEMDCGRICELIGTLISKEGPEEGPTAEVPPEAPKKCCPTVLPNVLQFFKAAGRIGQISVDHPMMTVEKVEKEMRQDVLGPGVMDLLSQFMLEKVAAAEEKSPVRRGPLSKAQYIEAFLYIIHNDEDFGQRFYENYLETCAKDAKDANKHK